jgi:hypothetical protein
MHRSFDFWIQKKHRNVGKWFLVFLHVFCINEISKFTVYIRNCSTLQLWVND